jgi:glutathione S-transferase
VAKLISNGADKALLGPQIANHFAFLEGELGRRDWFAGPDFTAADVQMSFPLQAASARVGFGGRMPNLQRFLDRIQTRPAYKRAVERGGTYTAPA